MRSRKRTLLAMLLGMVTAGLGYSLCAHADDEDMRPVKRRRRHYITTSALGTPRESAFVNLYRGGDDKSFINTMGIDRKTFETLLIPFKSKYDALIEEKKRKKAKRLGLPPPEKKNTKAGRPTSIVGHHVLLGLALHYLNSTMLQKTLCQIFNLAPSLVCRCLWDSIHALRQALQCWPGRLLEFPSHQRIRWLASFVSARHPELAEFNIKAFAFMDGTTIPVSSPIDPLTQNSLYSGKEKATKVNNIFMWGADGTILCCYLNAPGMAVHNNGLLLCFKVFPLLFRKLA
jgi:hypothetical protein